MAAGDKIEKGFLANLGGQKQVKRIAKMIPDFMKSSSEKKAEKKPKRGLVDTMTAELKKVKK